MDRRAALLALTLVGLALAAVPPAKAVESYVEGTVEGIWTLEGSPYILVGNVTIPEGAWLEIQEGVEVRATRGVGLTALGTLFVHGAAGAPVRFTANGTADAGYWQGIHLMTGGSLLRHAIVQHAETALTVSGYSTAVYGSSLSGNFRGLQVQDGAVDVVDTSISQNVETGLVARNAAVSIASSLLSGNKLGMDLAGSDALVENTTFLGPTMTDLTLDGGSYVRLRASAREAPVKFLDSVSRVDIEGILAVGVADAHGTPTVDARVQVDDNENGTRTVVARTEFDGRVRGLVLREQQWVNGGATDFNPFSVTAEANGWQSKTVVVLHGKVEVTLALTVDLASPVPVSLGVLTVAEDTVLLLDASGSTDNDPSLETTGSFAWSFPEIGVTLEGFQTTYTFDTPTLYQGILAVTDAAGNSAYASFAVRVLDTTAPVIEHVVVSDGTVGQPITFEATASDNDPTFASGATYVWRFTLGSATAERYGRRVAFVPEAPGGWTASLTVVDPSGNEASRQFRFDVAVPAPPPLGPWPAIVGGSALLAAAIGLATERGKIGLLTLLIPLYTRLKDGEVLDQFTRGQIYGYIRVHPGDTYTDIKRNLDLNNGTLTYHLDVLEKQGLVRSVVRGARKMFYPVDIRPPDDGGGLHEVQRRLLKGLDEAPGIAVSDLAESLGLSRQLALYHLRILAGRGIVRLERRGIKLCGYLPGREGRA